MMSTHNQVPSDVLRLMQSSLTHVADFALEDLEKYAHGGHGPAFAYLGMRHFWGLGGISMIDQVRANELFVSAIECDGCMEGYGMLLCANASTAPSTPHLHLHKDLTPFDVAAKLEDTGLWDVILNDESTHCAPFFACIVIGYGLRQIPPHLTTELLPSVMKRHEDYVETRTKSAWFTGFMVMMTVSLALLKAHENEPEKPHDFSQLTTLCDSYGSCGTILFDTIAKGLSVGRPPFKYVGLLSQETMDELAMLLYGFLCEVHNFPFAHFECGLAYSVGGLGCKQDFFKAFEHFEKGTKHDHNSCLYSLAAYYQSGIGGVVKRDMEYAESLRARMTDKLCTFNLGFFPPASSDNSELFDTEGQPQYLEDCKAAKPQ